MKASLSLLILLCILSAPIARAQPVITEIVAINDGSLPDKDGDFSAWVEIHNPTTEQIDLKDWYATDNADNLTKALLPRLRVNAGEYALLFLSGKDFSSLFNPEVHTGFEFTDDDDYFALVDPDGTTIVDSISDIQHRATMSYGRLDPATSEFALLRTPTPGEANRNPLLGVVKDTKFSVDRGFHTEPIEVIITTATEGARILYTTSGRAPSEGTLFTGVIEHEYTGPITISETTVLRAAAFKEGYAPSNIDTQTYLFPEDVVKQETLRTAITESPQYGPQLMDALTSLPSISLAVDDLNKVTAGTANGNDIEYLTSVELLNPDGSEGFQVDAGVSRFGGYFTDFAKKSFRLYFRKRYGEAKLKYPLYRGYENGIAPVEEFDSINLRSGSHDMNARGAYLSNRFVDNTLLEMGSIAPHGRFVHVYFNGIYWGQYHLRERWSAAMHASYFGGDRDDYEAINGNNTGSEFLPGEPYDGSGEYWNETLALSKGSTPFQALQNHIDFNSYLGFQLAWVSGNSESEFQSAGSRVQNVPFTFYFKDADGYLRPPGNRLNNRGPGDIFRQLQDEGDPEFRQLLADAIHKHYFNNGAFTATRNIARLQALVDETQLSFLTESARWNFRTPTSWQGFQDTLINSQLPRLTDDMIRLFKNADWYPKDIQAPVFNHLSGEIEPGFKFIMQAGTLFNPQKGELLYTLDGSDPRMPGGAHSASALTYERQGPALVIDATTTVKARSFDLEGQWSPLTEARLQVGKTPAPGDLAITEIHYRPAAPTPEEASAGFDSRNHFEFVEIRNLSDQTLSLIDVALTRGVQATLENATQNTIAPGAFIVIASNPDAFVMRYGSNLPLIGSFDTSKLSNGGETLRLALTDGQVLLEQRYDNKEPWPSEDALADRSLTLKDPQQLPTTADPTQWRASSKVGGSPGTLDDEVASPIQDQDGDGLPAFAEIALGTSDMDASSGPNQLQIADETWTINSTTDLYRTITVRKAAAASANQFELETSADLKTWSPPVGYTRVEVGADSESLQWLSDQPSSLTDQEQQFFRLKIVAP